MAPAHNTGIIMMTFTVRGIYYKSVFPWFPPYIPSYSTHVLNTYLISYISDAQIYRWSFLA